MRVFGTTRGTKGAVRGRRARSALAAAALLTIGCYSHVPVTTAPARGATLIVELTDEGRVAVRGQLGPEIRLVEGPLLETDDGGLVMSVIAIESLDGSRSQWNGERLSLATVAVKDVEERRFSRSRTLVAAVGAAVAAYAIVAAQRLLGGGRTTDGERPPPPPPG